MIQSSLKWSDSPRQMHCMYTGLYNVSQNYNKVIPMGILTALLRDFQFYGIDKGETSIVVDWYKIIA